MSTPARRRRSTSKGTKTAAAAAAVAVIAALAAGHVLIWVTITAAIAVVAYTLGRLHDSPPPARKPPSEFKRRQRTQAPRKPPKADTQARRNGWLPPAKPQTVTLTLSDACAEGECHLCDGCEHQCSHDPVAIAGRNQAAYDAAHPDPDPAGTNPPF